ncbi:hypothetical protein F5Y11DRAFT_361456 [Daldinia sp. FL1419]|nr:hypothetical protein F5Y11DRAFT_361456 [Daldinia sp. FL1419]
MTTPTFTAGITAATSLGPLTTTYSAPSSCFPPTPYTDTEDGTKIYKVGTVSAGDDCLPPDWVVNGYYSPGVCPHGYTAVCEAPGDSVTTTVCCPYYNLDYFQCYPGVKFGKYGCGYYTSFGGTELATVLAPSIQIVNAADNTDSITGTSSSLGSRPTGSVSSSREQTGPTNTINSNLFNTNTNTNTGSLGPSASGTAPGGTSAQNDPDLSNSGLRVLGGGAIAGIVVGVVGALILGAAGTFFFMRRSGMINKNPPPSSPSPPAVPSPKPDGTLIHELHDKSRPPEMPESNALYELHQPHSQSEMPTWSEHNPQGPNKPMAWELPA